MKTRKHTTPLLSALAASMVCTSLVSALTAHGAYEKYDTEGWGQPIIAVLMEGISHQGDSYPLSASSQSSTGEIPDVLAGQPEQGISGSVAGGGSGYGSNGAQDTGATGSGNQAGGDSGQGSNGTPGTGITGSGNNPGGSGLGSNGAQGAGGTGSGNQAGSSDYGSNGMQGAEGTGSGNNAGHASGSGETQGVGHTSSGSNAGGGSGTTQGTGTTGSGSNVGHASGGMQGAEATGSGNQAGSPGYGSSTTQGTGATGSGGNAGSGSGGQQSPDPAGQPQPGQYAFTEVEPDYFDDALFIGDSRVAGVALYSGWDNLTYYAENGMTVYNLFQSKAAQIDGQTLTIEEALQKHSFGKIYLEIGINEMGTGTVDSFMEAYEAAVAHLQELQPDAIIYVCGIMYVKQSKSESDPIFNNPAIQEKNDRIAALADGERVFYLDINEVVTDDTGHLNPDYTWDEVHLLGKYDVLWLEYFSSHAIVKDIQNPS